jgi:hypothetical protein
MATPRSKAKKTTKGRQRSDDLKNFWTGQRDPVKFGDDEWRATVLRGRGTQSLDISDLIESVEWMEDAPILTGSVSLRKPQDHPRLDVGEGHQIMLEHRYAGGRHWRELWRMRIGSTQDNEGVTITPKENTYGFLLADELAQVQRTKADFKIRKDKAHPKGERVDLALRRFCRAQRIPHRPFPRMRHYIKKQSFHQKSQVDILQSLIRTENTNSTRDYILRWRTGRVEVIRKQRSKFMVQFSDTIIDATLTQKRRSGFATIIKVVGTADKGKGKDSKGKVKHKKQHVRATVTRASLQQRYGKITKTIHVKADSVAEARKRGKQELANVTRPKDTVSFTHPGVPSVRRWSAAHIEFKEQDYSEVCYVSSARHSVTPGDYTMDIEVQFTDPFKKKKAKKKAKKKSDAAKKRGRSSGSTHTSHTSHPQPAKARQRGDHPAAKTPSKPRVSPGQQLANRGLR